MKLGITAAVAVSLRWCVVPPPGDQQREAQRCVGEDGRVVEDRYCDQDPGTGHSFHWYYGGDGYYPGQRASGGSDRPTPDAAPVRTSSGEFRGGAGGESGVTRGGFGGTAEGAGSGE